VENDALSICSWKQKLLSHLIKPSSQLISVCSADYLKFKTGWPIEILKSWENLYCRDLPNLWIPSHLTLLLSLEYDCSFQDISIKLTLICEWNSKKTVDIAGLASAITQINLEEFHWKRVAILFGGDETEECSLMRMPCKCLGMQIRPPNF